jgi:hypothetical protein
MQVVGHDGNGVDREGAGFSYYPESGSQNLDRIGIGENGAAVLPSPG